jgi:glycosyltransferase involved in cell wall biosynthesis
MKGNFDRTDKPHIDVSVIMTVYNLELYVEDAILSVLKQTVEPVEIIVIDDCSTDGSAEVIKKYADRVKYIKMQETRVCCLLHLRA